MAVVGPWAIAVYKAQGQLGRRPGADQGGHRTPSEIHTFSDAKNIGLYSACENQKTAWDVLKFATSEEQDGKLLEMTGQMPIRTTWRRPTPTTSRSNPDYEAFADQAVAHRRGAQRAELDRDLAGVPRHFALGGDLRQDVRWRTRSERC